MESGQPAAAPADRSARLGAAIAGAGGVLLLLSLFLTWYELPGAELAKGRLGEVLDDLGGVLSGREVNVGDAVTRSGWEAFEVIDVICVFAAIVAIARAGVALLGQDDNPSVPGAVLVGAIGAVALFLIVYRVIDPPLVGLDRKLGLWVGLFGAGSIVYGSYVAMQSDSKRL